MKGLVDAIASTKNFAGCSSATNRGHTWFVQLERLTSWGASNALRPKIEVGRWELWVASGALGPKSHA